MAQERVTQSPSTPETALMRVLFTAYADAQATLARRMRMHSTDLAAMDHLAFATAAMGPSDLAGRLGISPAATTEVVDRLERAGHLVRHRDESDRRRIRLEPTPSAIAEVLDQLGGLIDGMDALVEAMPSGDRAAIRRYLQGAIEVYRTWSEEPPAP